MKPQSGDVNEAIDWTKIRNLLNCADEAANPVGSRRLVSSAAPLTELQCIAGAPGEWTVARAWQESGVWMHEIVRTL